jgi:hypothetical protein
MGRMRLWPSFETRQEAAPQDEEIKKIPAASGRELMSNFFLFEN